MTVTFITEDLMRFDGRNKICWVCFQEEMEFREFTIFLFVAAAFHLSSAAAVQTTSKCNGTVVRDLATIRSTLVQWNHTLTLLNQESTVAEWNWASNITAHNEEIKSEVSAKTAAKIKEIWYAVACFDCTAAKCEEEDERFIATLSSVDTAALPPSQFDDFTYIQTTMENIYSTAKVCPPDGSHCYDLEPDLADTLSNSDDYCKLQWAWHGWHNESGRKIRGFYTGYVLLQNEAAHLNDFVDAKEMWTSGYTSDDNGTFFDQMDQAWRDVKPLYQQLHAYVRRKLMTTRHAKFAAQFPKSRHIPAHLLGNMWAQEWTDLYNLVLPYPNAPVVDVTALLKEKNYSIMDMFHLSDKFFQSIGLRPMTEEFWQKSIFKKPSDDTQMVCHASAWDFHSPGDFRIKMCSEVNHNDFQTVHHEMGHIQYFMQYENQMVQFREGANPGFHEAIGDVIGLSVMTPAHLKAIGLLPRTFVEDNQTTLNSLMAMALGKVAFLPFGYLVDKYRWAIFDGNTSFSHLNAEWWKLRCAIQGISPPVLRTEEDFDAGAKYHVAASVPYDRYFFSFIAQFQFHRAICQKMGLTKDFHNCDIYNQTEATKALRDAMALGASRPYPEVMKLLTNSTRLDSSAIIDYFAPLYDWLKEQNKDEGDIAWEDDCPTMPVASPCGDYSSVKFNSVNSVFTAANPTVHLLLTIITAAIPLTIMSSLFT